VDAPDARQKLATTASSDPASAVSGPGGDASPIRRADAAVDGRGKRTRSNSEAVRGADDVEADSKRTKAV